MNQVKESCIHYKNESYNDGLIHCFLPVTGLIHTLSAICLIVTALIQVFMCSNALVKKKIKLKKEVEKFGYRIRLLEKQNNTLQETNRELPPPRQVGRTYVPRETNPDIPIFSPPNTTGFASNVTRRGPEENNLLMDSLPQYGSLMNEEGIPKSNKLNEIMRKLKTKPK